LKNPLSENELSDLSYIRQHVHYEVLKTENMLSLQEMVKDSIASLNPGPNHRTEEKPIFALVKSKNSQLPPYQIERLLF